MAESKFTIACFGDSLVEGEGDEAKKGGWVGRLAEMLPANTRPNKCRVLNLGVGGDTIRDLEYRLGEVMLRNPDMVILGCATNDLTLITEPVHQAGVPERRTSYYLATKAWPHVLDVLSKTVPYVAVMQKNHFERADGSTHVITEADTIRWNKYIAKLCAERNIPFWEIKGMEQGKHYQPCGHPNAAGYDVYAEQIYKYISQTSWLPNNLKEAV